MCLVNLLQAKAVYDFESGGPGELSFYTNELLTILRQVKSLHHILCMFVTILSLYISCPIMKNRMSSNTFISVTCVWFWAVTL